MALVAELPLSRSQGLACQKRGYLLAKAPDYLMLLQGLDHLCWLEVLRLTAGPVPNWTHQCALRPSVPRFIQGYSVVGGGLRYQWQRKQPGKLWGARQPGQ